MGESQNKSDEARFEESLRQILDSGPSGAQTAAEPPGPARPARPEAETRKTADNADAEPKALFWFKLARVLAIPALLALLVKFVLRITAARG